VCECGGEREREREGCCVRSHQQLKGRVIGCVVVGVGRGCGQPPRGTAMSSACRVWWTHKSESGCITGVVYDYIKLFWTSYHYSLLILFLPFF